MKTKTLASLLILTMIMVVGLSVVSTQAVSAQETIEGNLDALADTAGLPGDTVSDSSVLIATIGRVIKIFLGFLAIIFIILVIYAGFLWMTSAGDSAKVDKAKGIITNAIIGLVIILAAYIITSFVVDAVLDSTTGVPN